MSDRKKIYDVFLTSAVDAVQAAAAVETMLIRAGLAVFSPLHIANGGNLWERAREELGASLSLVAVLGDRASLSPHLAVEVGAALAWNKPTFAVLNDLSDVEQGNLPAEVQAVDMVGLEKIVRVVRQIRDPLSPEQRQVLAEVYAEVNVPTDQLPRSPEALDRFTDRFNKVTGRHWSGERLLREVLVLRKSGRLPRLRKNGDSAHHRVPA